MKAIQLDTMIKYSSIKNQESTRLIKIGGVHLHRREQRHQRSPGLSPGNPHALFIIINHFSHHHQFRYLALKTGETLVEDVLSFEFGRRIFIVTIIQPFVTDVQPDRDTLITHLGVERSLPMLLVYSRNSWVISAQTVWLPRSHASVLNDVDDDNVIISDVITDPRVGCNTKS